MNPQSLPVFFFLFFFHSVENGTSREKNSADLYLINCGRIEATYFPSYLQYCSSTLFWCESPRFGDIGPLTNVIELDGKQQFLLMTSVVGSLC